MVCKRVFCAEFPDITDNAGKTTRRIRKRRRTQAIAKRFSFHSNAVKGEKEHLTFEKKTFNIRRGGGLGGGGCVRNILKSRQLKTKTMFMST